jgi:hypothetical protein
VGWSSRRVPLEPNCYHFVSNWCFRASIEEVSAVLQDIDSLSQWWPSVYLEVEILESGDVGGIGRRVRLLTKGRLPYRLRWEFVVAESHPPHGYRIEANGDLRGFGEWKLTQAGEIAEVEFIWDVRAEKPLLRRFSRQFRPVFEWNHAWAMAQGQKCLCAELKRRRRGCKREAA